jgi:hypothetical protein
METKETQENEIQQIVTKAKDNGHPKPQAKSPADPTRRTFLGQVGAAGALAWAAGAIAMEPVLGGKNSAAEASTVPYLSDSRAEASNAYRQQTAEANHIDVGVLPDNADRAAFTDFSALYSKALRHDGLGVPNANSWLSLVNALQGGNFSNLQNVIVGTPGGGPNSRLNGPAGSFALDLEGLDSYAFRTPPPTPGVRSAQTASEQVEHYWAALLRDVPFSQYPTNSLVAQAVADLNSRSFIQSSANNQFPFPVKPENLFRGQITPGDGNVQGPYISQFMVQPTSFGVQPLSQRYQTFLPVGGGGADYMVDVASYQNIQNGGASGEPNFDSTFRFIRNGRDLTAYTRVDVPYQAYLVAFLVLNGIRAPANRTNPYNGSNTQKPFLTLGGPDAAGTIAEMATRALKASWVRKWIVDLRLRPEEYGALVEARRIGSRPVPQASGALHSDVLTSAVLPILLSAYGTHLMPQAFPEGSPTHPCYTGAHATVAGACTTLLKFFFDGSQRIRPLLEALNPPRDIYVPTADGLSLQIYAGPDIDRLDINGELNKLAFNICFGHGVHAGIHFRSSNYWGILLGEAVALSVLEDRARSYNEPFTISITKFDGTTATITNQTPRTLPPGARPAGCPVV